MTSTWNTIIEVFKAFRGCRVQSDWRGVGLWWPVMFAPEKCYIWSYMTSRLYDWLFTVLKSSTAPNKLLLLVIYRFHVLMLATTSAARHSHTCLKSEGLFAQKHTFLWQRLLQQVGLWYLETAASAGFCHIRNLITCHIYAEKMDVK